MATIVRIFVEGNIGSGKSTFLADVKAGHANARYKSFEMVVVTEPLNEMTQFLEPYYNDPQRYSFMLQTVFLAARIKAVLAADAEARALAASSGKPVVMLIERGPDSDLLFGKVNREINYMSELEYQGYLAYVRLLIDCAKVNSTVSVYVRPGVDKCIERKFSRGRTFEGAIPRDYMERLEKAHDEFFCRTGESRTISQGGGTVIHMDNPDEHDELRRSCTSYEVIVRIAEHMLDMHHVRDSLDLEPEGISTAV